MYKLELPPVTSYGLPPAAYLEGEFATQDGYPGVFMEPAAVDSIATMGVTASFNSPLRTGVYRSLRLVLSRDGTPMTRTTVRRLPEDKTFVSGMVTVTLKIPAGLRVFIHSGVETGGSVPLKLDKGTFTASRIAARF